MISVTFGTFIIIFVNIPTREVKSDISNPNEFKIEALKRLQTHWVGTFIQAIACMSSGPLHDYNK